MILQTRDDILILEDNHIGQKGFNSSKHFLSEKTKIELLIKKKKEKDKSSFLEEETTLKMGIKKKGTRINK